MKQGELPQSLGFVELFSSLAGGAVIIWLVWRLAEAPMASMNDRAQLESVRRSVQWTDVLLNNLPVVFLLIAVVGSIAWVVFQTRFA
jgi:hypothetical protein